MSKKQQEKLIYLERQHAICNIYNRRIKGLFYKLLIKRCEKEIEKNMKLEKEKK